MSMSLSSSNLEIVTVQCGNQYRDIIIRKESSDRFVLGQIFTDQSYNLSTVKRIGEITELYFSILKSGREPCIVDAGANIGASSVYFALMMKGARVISIEPDEQNFTLLTKNVDGLNVTAVRAALTSDGRSCEVNDIGNAEWGMVTSLLSEGNQVSAGHQVQVVPGTTINDIFKEFPSALPFIVKIDIEGAEEEVFSKNAEWIRKVPLLIVEPHDWLFPGRGTMVNFFRKLSELNFDIEVSGENILVINNDASIWKQ